MNVVHRVLGLLLTGVISAATVGCEKEAPEPATRTLSVTRLSSAPQTDAPGPVHGFTSVGTARVDNAVLARTAGSTKTDVIVELRADPELANLKIAHARRQDLVRDALARGLGSLGGALPLVRHRFRNLPYVALTIDDAALQKLAQSPFVASIQLDRPTKLHLVQGGAMIGATTVRADGVTGVGQTVAIIDSGIDYTHPALGGGLGPSFKVLGGYDFVNDDADPMDDNGHGTSAAGIVASIDATNRGIAPDAKLVALKTQAADGNGSFSTADAALDWVFDNAATYGISVVNMSIGTDTVFDNSADCDIYSTAAWIQLLEALDIAVFVSSGNGGCGTGISFPACASSAIAVGAVYDASFVDTRAYATAVDCPGPFTCTGGVDCCADFGPAADSITCYTNSGALLDVLAPSHDCVTPTLGGGFNTQFGGTSAASPYAAGAAALLLDTTDGALSPAALKQALIDTGTPRTDPKNSLSFPRINVLSAAESVNDCFGEVDGTPCDDQNACTADACSGGTCVGTTISCDDGNSCTDDTCDAGTGCANTDKADFVSCDDGNPCTTADFCSGGVCSPAFPTICPDDANPCTDVTCDSGTGCGFVDKPDFESCDDGNPCTSADFCSSGVCSPAFPTICPDDANPCTDVTCDSGTGCGFTNNTDSCDDGSACTTGDVCSAGDCDGTPVVCPEDSDVCTTATCDSVSGCGFTDNTAPCNDGDACTTGDQCSAGSCQPGGPLSCPEDANPCTTAACDSVSGCGFTDNTDSCDDGSACTSGDVCSAGDCDGTPVVCPEDGDVCTTATCDSVSGCGFTDNAASCDDGDACTTGDQCSAGACSPGTPVVCPEDSDVCTTATCDSVSGCGFTDNTASCDDGDACTSGDICSAGTCQPGGPLSCPEDSNPCTTAACDSVNGCGFTNNTDSCDDGSACTTGDVCSAGDCDGTPVVCPEDGDVCTTATCDSVSGCGFADNTDPCNDGDACTTGDQCSAGACSPGTPVVCPEDGDVCTTATCDSVSGCGFTDNTASCDDGDACTTGDICSGGDCSPGSPVTCPEDSNPCTTAACDSVSGCGFTDNTATCDDGDACTSGDICSAGACSPGSSVTCPEDSNPCTTAACDSVSGCGFTDNTASCDDGDACTSGDVCSAGACSPGAPVVCPEDSDVCTTATCDSATGCGFTDNTASCDDGDACTTGDVCSAGGCDGAPVVCPEDSEVCTTASCDSATGCGFTNNTASCDDGDACTLGDQCNGGACGSGTPKSCDDGDVCTDDSCNSGTGECLHADNVATCDDGSACTTTDVCGEGLCAGVPQSCDDSNPCTTDSCGPLDCEHAALVDGTSCGTSLACFGGLCEPLPVGDDCAQMITLELGVAYAGDLENFHDFKAVPAACAGSELTGVDAFHTVTLEPGDYRVELMPTGQNPPDLALAVWDGCTGGSACLTARNDNAAGAGETIASYTVGLTQPLVVQVKALGPVTEPAPYSLLVSVLQDGSGGGTGAGGATGEAGATGSSGGTPGASGDGGDGNTSRGGDSNTSDGGDGNTSRGGDSNTSDGGDGNTSHGGDGNASGGAENGGSADGGVNGAGQGGDRPAGLASPEPAGDGGCGCRVVGAPPQGRSAAALALIVALGLFRRRRDVAKSRA